MVIKLNDITKLAIEFLTPATIGLLLIGIVGAVIQGYMMRTIIIASLLTIMIYPLHKYLSWYYKKFFN